MAKDKDIIPSITPDREDVASRRRTGRSEAPRQSNFNGLLVFVIVLMAILMGFGGYTIFEVQKQLEESNVLLAQGQDNHRELEARLAATGTDVSKTLQDVKEQVATNFSEIDKLWKVAYRQNRPDIQKNVRDIATLKDDLGARVTAMDRSVKQMAGQYQTTLSEITTLREGLLQDNEELLTEIALLRGQLQDQAVDQEAVRRRLNSLGQQHKETGEAINSIDQHRRQLAQKIVELERLLQSTGTTGP